MLERGAVYKRERQTNLSVVQLLDPAHGPLEEHRQLVAGVDSTVTCAAF